jgi:hypothetical protein
MLSIEFALSAAKLSSHGCGALPLEKPYHRGHRVLRGNGNTPMNRIREQIPFQSLAIFLLGQSMENLP